MRVAVSAALLSLALGVGAALAQTNAPAPAPAPGPAAKPAVPSTKATTDKEAISKSCSDQANAKGLHGKARRKFRADCKRAGGKSK